MSAYRSCSTAKKYINAPKLWGFRKWNAINLGLVPRPLFGCLLKSQNYYFLYLFPIHMYIVCVCVGFLGAFWVGSSENTFRAFVFSNFSILSSFFFLPWMGVMWFGFGLILSATGDWRVRYISAPGGCFLSALLLQIIGGTLGTCATCFHKGGLGNRKWEMGKGGMGFSFPQSLHHRPIPHPWVLV